MRTNTSSAYPSTGTCRACEAVAAVSANAAAWVVRGWQSDPSAQDESFYAHLEIQGMQWMLSWFLPRLDP